MSVQLMVDNRAPITLRWNQLVWAINHDGHGRPLAFDDGFRACLRALGVSEHDIAVLFGEATTEHDDYTHS